MCAFTSITHLVLLINVSPNLSVFGDKEIDPHIDKSLCFKGGDLKVTVKEAISV